MSVFRAKIPGREKSSSNLQWFTQQAIHQNIWRCSQFNDLTNLPAILIY